MQSQLLYMTGWDAILQISEKEKRNLSEYLKAGGFLFAEEIRHSDPDDGLAGLSPGVAGTPFDRQFKALMKDSMVLGSDGAKWQKIPPKHPLYTIYWDLEDGPPLGGAPGGDRPRYPEMRRIHAGEICVRMIVVGVASDQRFP